MGFTCADQAIRSERGDCDVFQFSLLSHVEHRYRSWEAGRFVPPGLNSASTA